MLLVAIFMVICYVDVLVDIMVDIFHVGVQHVATLLAGMHLFQGGRPRNKELCVQFDFSR